MVCSSCSIRFINLFMFCCCSNFCILLSILCSVLMLFSSCLCVSTLSFSMFSLSVLCVVLIVSICVVMFCCLCRMWLLCSRVFMVLKFSFLICFAVGQLL